MDPALSGQPSRSSSTRLCASINNSHAPNDMKQSLGPIAPDEISQCIVLLLPQPAFTLVNSTTLPCMPTANQISPLHTTSNETGACLFLENQDPQPKPIFPCMCGCALKDDKANDWQGNFLSICQGPHTAGLFLEHAAELTLS